ncbi:MAG: threonine synthase [Hyphomonadaceae bacterium]|nr:threonine synthase [Hyphomonadaceae bacterium]
MRYISTRGQAPPVSFLDAVLAGMAPDGGLYVPERWPHGLDSDEARADIGQREHFEVAANILHAFAGDELTIKKAYALALKAYSLNAGAFDSRVVTPLVQLGGGHWVLELFHGPSLSFKDIAMQLIGPLYDHALAARDRRLTVVCATSGDTGGAAVEALKGRERADLFVLTPRGRVSEVQRRFMTTSGASNIYALEVDGDFDACQAIVKTLFADQDFSARASLSGVNSINWARIVAQSAYFYATACLLSGPGKVNFIVPTGNFGDAYSGWVAKQLGAPIGKIALATNANDILDRALLNGSYERATQSLATLSPAMDIQVASNFERIVFEVVGRDSGATSNLYDQFAREGSFDIPADARAALAEHFYAASVSDESTIEEIGFRWGEGYLACPHTAVGLHAPQEEFAFEEEFHAPIVYLATAHPAKFPDTVERATGVRPQLPAKCADLFQRSEKFDSLPADAEAVKQYIRERSRAWS